MVPENDMKVASLESVLTVKWSSLLTDVCFKFYLHQNKK